ncbi:MAG: hypothetical protein LBB47_02485 [Spirochaetaceae bacterium]|jgi:hypothetical protein|nr:hypothetical protein [Spirochaetaceae bacterium]
MNTLELLERFKGEEIFLKSCEKRTLDAQEKARLNRKGNMLLNQGDVETARRIFITTGYSDGLSRIGDYYRSKGRVIDALRMYWIAPDKKKSTELIMELSFMVKNLIHEGDNDDG